MPAIIQENRLVHYLLGELSEAEKTEVEDLYLADQDFFERLLAAEDDLIDEYVHQRLSKKETRLFEENFLTSPERRDRVKAARALLRFVEGNQVVKEKATLAARMLSYFKVGSTAMRLAVSAAMVVVLAVVAGMWIKMARMGSELAEVRSGQQSQLQREEVLKHELEEQKRTSGQLDEELKSERSERGRLQQEVAKLSEPRAEVVSEVLGFGVVERPRGGFPEESRKKIVVPKNAELVRLRLNLLKVEYSGYVVILENEGAQEVWRAGVSSTKGAKGAAVVIRIPARLLKDGRYSLVLNGATEAKTLETISEYPILVEKK